MAIQRVTGPKEILLNLWLDLEKCIRNASFTQSEELCDFERLVIVLEDRRYLRHRGIYYKSIARVLIHKIAGSRKGGASTIEMQFVRTVTGRYERTLRRKVREIVLARLLCFHCTKYEILRGYLSIAYFGRHANGSESASMRLFGKARTELSKEEAAKLAALLVYPAPEDMKNANWVRKVGRRAKYGLRLLSTPEKGRQKLTKRNHM